MEKQSCTIVVVEKNVVVVALGAVSMFHHSSWKTLVAQVDSDLGCSIGRKEKTIHHSLIRRPTNRLCSNQEKLNPIQCILEIGRSHNKFDESSLYKINV